MNSGLLVVVALFLIYLAVSGKYSCVTAAMNCFKGAKLCECGPGAKTNTPVAGAPTGLERAIEAGRELYDRLRRIGHGR